jgi:hypothetical protein
LEQATYVLNHAELGDLTLFLVPIAADETSRTHEAVFTVCPGDAAAPFHQHMSIEVVDHDEAESLVEAQRVAIGRFDTCRDLWVR